MGENYINLPNKIAFAFLFLISFAVHSQYYHGLDIGINTTSATLDIDGSSNSENAIGFSVGYMYERDLSNMMFIRLGVSYNRRSFKAESVSGVTLYNEKWSSDAIELPINIGHYLNFNQRNFQFFVDAGANIAYNNRATIKNDTETIYLDIGKDADIKRMAFGANASIGLLIKKRVKFRVNYYHGLSNMANTDGYNWKNKTFSIALNYFLKEKEIVY